MYHAIWDSVADWYIEASKDQDNPDLLAWVIDTSLRLAHPFAPFVTETIWQTLSWHDSLLISETWPEIIHYDEISAAEFGRVQQLVTEARFVINELPGNEKYSLLYQDDSLVEDNKDLIKRLAKLKDVTSTDQPKGLRLAASGRAAWLDVSEETLAEHQINLEERLAATHRDIQALQNRLGNASYVEKAPAALVDETKKQLEEKEAVVVRLQHELEVLS